MVIRRALALALVVVGGFQAVVVAFVHPPQIGLPTRVDAVVVLSGDHGDRLDRAIALVQGGLAPTLVILRPSDGPAEVAAPLCRGGQAFEVVCADPPVVSTRGDGRYLEQLVSRRGWHRVVVVTSRFHLLRSSVLMRRCTDVDVSMASSRPHFGVKTWGRAISHEVGGLAEALVLKRGC
jgi:uncharacterized SAM-binding protein YcdF (DUF218 family)